MDKSKVVNSEEQRQLILWEENHNFKIDKNYICNLKGVKMNVSNLFVKN
jgi:hypothetical protein